jgi:hypothetical protein
MRKVLKNLKANSKFNTEDPKVLGVAVQNGAAGRPGARNLDTPVLNNLVWEKKTFKKSKVSERILDD